MASVQKNVNLEFSKFSFIRNSGHRFVFERSISPDFPRENNIVEGLLVKDKFNYNLLACSEISLFTPLTCSEIYQELIIPFNNNVANLLLFLTSMFRIEINGQTNEIKIINMVLIKIFKDQLNVYWHSNPINDLIVDSIVGLIMTLHTDIKDPILQINKKTKVMKKEKNQWWNYFLEEHFKDFIRYDYTKKCYKINKGNTSAKIKVIVRNNRRSTLKISSNCMKLYKKIELLMSCIDTALYPLKK